MNEEQNKTQQQDIAEYEKGLAALGLVKKKAEGTNDTYYWSRPDSEYPYKNTQNPTTPAVTPTPAETQLEQEQAEERAALAQAQESELAGLQQNNQQRYNDLSQIVSEAETRLGELKQKDEVAQKRSNAFRYIAGVGDTLSGLANLVGTAHGAANQEQTYNGGMVAQRAEQSRKERKLEMDKISGRLDEMRAREKELKTAGSLAEAELKAKQNREQLELKSKQAATRREEDWKRTQQKWKEEEAARAQELKERELEIKENKPPKQTSPKKQHSFDLVGGESITIPEHLWTDTAITSVYSSIPEELRTRRQRMRKNIAGIDEPEVDASGNPVYHTPTKQEMLNDIVAIAKTNEDVANALRKYAIGATTGANDPEFE